MRCDVVRRSETRDWIRVAVKIEMRKGEVNAVRCGEDRPVASESTVASEPGKDEGRV